MKKYILIALGLVFTLSAVSQEASVPTASFIISGEVKSPVAINIADFKKWTAVPVEDVVITNHLGERKSEATGMKGIRLREVLASVEITAETPKVLSEYYFVCKANDGYTVVYSWNELFNTAIGDSVYIITEKDHQPAILMKESVLMLSPKDFKTGRRHVKSLSEINVRRAR